MGIHLDWCQNPSAWIILRGIHPPFCSQFCLGLHSTVRLETSACKTLFFNQHKLVLPEKIEAVAGRHCN